MEDMVEIVKSLEGSGSLIKGITRTFETMDYLLCYWIL